MCMETQMEWIKYKNDKRKEQQKLQRQITNKMKRKINDIIE